MDESYGKQLFTGGLPCAPGFRNCAPSSSDAQRPHDSWLWNELVEGALEPSDGEPAKFAVAPLGAGVYGIGLMPDAPKNNEPKDFSTRVAVQIHSCSPGYVPVVVAPGTTGDDVVEWISAAERRLARCEKPVQLSLDQPTKARCSECTALQLPWLAVPSCAAVHGNWQAVAHNTPGETCSACSTALSAVTQSRACLQGIVMKGNGGAAYFRYKLPPGLAGVYVTVRGLASDDPANTIDFYATRNVLWTKGSARDDLKSSTVLPLLTKDFDASALLEHDVSNLLVRCSRAPAKHLKSSLPELHNYLHMRHSQCPHQDI
jgi:hypothetical protein